MDKEKNYWQVIIDAFKEMTNATIEATKELDKILNDKK